MGCAVAIRESVAALSAAEAYRQLSGGGGDAHLCQFGGRARAAVLLSVHCPAADHDAEFSALRPALSLPPAAAARLSAGGRHRRSAYPDLHHHQPAVDRRAPEGGAGG